jgi:hypothetical protein
MHGRTAADNPHVMVFMDSGCRWLLHAVLVFANLHTGSTRQHQAAPGSTQHLGNAAARQAVYSIKCTPLQPWVTAERSTSLVGFNAALLLWQDGS